MSSSSLHVSFKAKNKSKSHKKAAEFVQVFLKWHRHVVFWRQLRWGYKYAEDWHRVKDGSKQELEQALAVCGGDYREATLLGFAKEYQVKFHCKGCNDLNDSKYKVYCASCTDKWKEAAEEKAIADIRSFCAVKFGTLVSESEEEEEEEQSGDVQLSQSGDLERDDSDGIPRSRVHTGPKLRSCP